MDSCCDIDTHNIGVNKGYTEIIVKNRWRFVKRLGIGSFDVVYKVVDINDESKSYAMKIILRKPKIGRLPQETLVLETTDSKRLLNHIPEIIDKGRFVTGDLQKPA